MVNKTKYTSNTTTAPITKWSIIIGRCKCDDVVKYPFYWCEELIQEANKIGLIIVDLQKDNFTEEKFTRFIKSHNPKIILLNGHGDAFSAFGFEKQPIIIANKNDYLLKGKVAHILSCFTAKFLAPSAMDKGCKGYLGYRDYFYISYLENEPENDKISKLFQDSVNSASKVLINGGSVKEAFEASQDTYEQKINECKGKFFQPSTSADMKDYLQDTIGALIWNKKNQIYFSSE